MNGQFILGFPEMSGNLGDLVPVIGPTSKGPVQHWIAVHAGHFE